MSNLVRHDQQVRRNYHHHKAEASALSLSLSLSLSPIWLGLFKTEKEENHKKTPKKKKPNQIWLQIHRQSTRSVQQESLH